MSKFGPFQVEAEGVTYDYRRFVLEIMECMTCGGVFQTHLATGMGQLATPEKDSPLCAGCLEICKSLEINEGHGAKPS